MKPIKPQLKLICLLNGLLIIDTSTVSHFIFTAHKIMLRLFCVPFGTCMMRMHIFRDSKTAFGIFRSSASQWKTTIVKCCRYVSLYNQSQETLHKAIAPSNWRTPVTHLFMLITLLLLLWVLDSRSAILILKRWVTGALRLIWAVALCRVSCECNIVLCFFVF